MSGALDLPLREQRRAHIAGLYAVLGIESDPWRAAWRDLPGGARRALLAVGGQSPTYLAGREWGELSDAARAAVKSAARRLRTILEGLPA